MNLLRRSPVLFAEGVDRGQRPFYERGDKVTVTLFDGMKPSAGCNVDVVLSPLQLVSGLLAGWMLFCHLSGL